MGGGDNFWILWGGHSCYEGGHRAHEGPPVPPTRENPGFEDCLRENDVVPDKNERDRSRKCLQNKLYSKLILKCYQSTGYYLL